MSTTSGPSNGQQATLLDKLAQWKARVSTTLDPMKERVVDTTNKVFGIQDLVQEQQDDIRQLGEKLALINGHVLSPGHLSPNSDVDERTMKLLQELIKSALSIPVMEAIPWVPVLVWKASFFALIDWTGSPEGLLLAEIPPAPVVFHGRDDLVESIVELVCRRETCRIPLLGPGGIGKTSIAAIVIHNRRVKAKYGRPEGILNALAASLPVPPGSDVLRTVLTCLLSQDRILLVLDNLETA
ncbi:hypothetical protein CALVIDRAFT_531933 [Calocera viscosa TUFC12733]|uniref:NB-ARC domain-containing protein n=1 Tax=Calocera viscosa (strain TUFC12733) TaxID=1330018 RepID=A0A167FN36_CALVF|nr:hypothetical protein CALVIDRAFT_531933 [Calocera viscosa TUFC12733]